MNLRTKQLNSRSVLVVLDDTEWGTLPTKRLLSFLPGNPPEGVEIDDPAEIVALIRQTAWNRLQHFLAIRERNRRECDTHLRQAHLHPELRRELIDKAIEYGYLDDRRYTGMIVRVSLGRGVSSRMIRYQLNRAGIDAALVEEVLREEMPDDTADTIRREHIDRLRRKYARDDARTRYRKTLAALYRLGYAWDEIQDDLQRMMDKEGD